MPQALYIPLKLWRALEATAEAYDDDPHEWAIRAIKTDLQCCVDDEYEDDEGPRPEISEKVKALLENCP